MNRLAAAHVVLLHGLARSRASWAYAEYRLRRAGFSTVNIGYPSRRQPIEDLARGVAAQLPAGTDRPVHFLTHSLGGIILRQLVKAHRPVNLARAVMLGTPNRGSQLASRLKERWLFQTVMGPAAQQIGTDAGSVPNSLGAVDFELGVIAGRNAIDPLRPFVAGESDGRVSVEETRVEGMTDWMCVARGHAVLMFDPRILDQSIHFFRHGRFAREA